MLDKPALSDGLHKRRYIRNLVKPVGVLCRWERRNMKDASAFDRYVGVDYSVAQTPTSSLKGLRVYMADRTSPPLEVPPPASPRRYWTRQGVAEWLAALLSEAAPTLVGIDHGFSFPLRYFQEQGLPLNWTALLDDFQRHWPTDESEVYVDF